MKKDTLKGGMDAKKESKWDAIHRLTMRWGDIINLYYKCKKYNAG